MGNGQGGGQPLNRQPISQTGFDTESRWPQVTAAYPHLASWGLERVAGKHGEVLDRLEAHLATCALREANPCRVDLRSAGREHTVVVPSHMNPDLLEEIACPALDRAWTLQHALRDSGVPRRFRGWLLRELDISEAREAALRYVDDFEQHQADGMGLLIAGPTGVGKTTMAAAIVAELLLRLTAGLRLNGAMFEPPIRFTTAYDLVRAAKDFDHPERIEDLARMEWLVIDDLGADPLTGFGIGELTQVIDERYRERRPTIITTNLARAAMAEYLGERAVSRLAECTTIVLLGGKDRRMP